MNHLKDYLRFSRIERRGIYALLMLILLVIIAKESLIYFNPPSSKPQFGKDSLISFIKEKENKLQKIDQRNSEEEVLKLESKKGPFKFNPNQLPLEKWIALGLSKKQATVIKNYEKKGGVFKVKKDVKKMYVISDELYERLYSFIQLPDSLSKEKTPGASLNSKVKLKKVYVVDINKADSSELIKLYGIGPYLAKAIVNHRERLGGYHAVEQLMDIWRISDTLIDKLDSQLQITPVPLKKLNINQLSAKELKEHPYIDWNIANSIVQMRHQRGPFKRLEEIKKSHLINDKLFEKLTPYIEIEDVNN